MPKIKARLLGGFELSNEFGEQLSIKGRKTRALLGILLVELNSWHTREQLAGMLWSDRGEPQARNSLNQALYEIRKLETESNVTLIEREADRIRLVGNKIETDVADVEAKLKTNSPETTNMEIGALLAGLDTVSPEFCSWLDAQQRQLRAALEATLRDLISKSIDGSNGEVGIAAARRLIDLDPLDERTRRSLMLLLACAGNRAEAIREYQSCAKVLKDELGIEPDPATRLVIERIKRSMFTADVSELIAEFLNPPMVNSARPGASANEVSLGAGAAQLVSREDQTIGFCRTADGVTLAYATFGKGSPVVFVQSWLTHMELDWDLPARRAAYESLGREHQVVRFDARGSGLSDSAPAEMTFETTIDDLATVIEALGLRNVALIGQSQGAATAAAYAARRFDNVTRLILYGGYARGRRMRDSDSQNAESEAFLTLIREGWGKNNDLYIRMFGSLFMPDANTEQLAAFADYQRRSTSPESAVRIRLAMDSIDIFDELPSISTPTLVLHRRDDAIAPFEEGRRMAAAIKGARFVPLEGRNHVMLSQDPVLQRYLTEVQAFLKE